MKKRQTWQSKLTKAELKHLNKVASGPGIRATLFSLESMFKKQAEIRRKDYDPVVEPCWICKGIAQKLGFEV